MATFKFWGHFQHSLDSKNRVAIPAKFRQQIADGRVVVTEFFGGCLAVYPEPEWEQLVANELAALSPIARGEELDTKRRLFGSAVPCDLDKQGRISLSAHHVERAGIKKEVVFKGLNTNFEIWDKERWEAWETAMDQREAEGKA